MAWGGDGRLVDGPVENPVWSENDTRDEDGSAAGGRPSDSFAVAPAVPVTVDARDDEEEAKEDIPDALGRAVLVSADADADAAAVAVADDAMNEDGLREPAASEFS